jgi:hypothetical protein
MEYGTGTFQQKQKKIFFLNRTLIKKKNNLNKLRV